jgi:hypothetical protein
VTESQILTLNERIRTSSSYLANLSAALMAATGARVWLNAGVDLSALAWLAIAIALFVISLWLLYLLEADLEDD